MKNTVRYWLISRHFLWTKKIFDNGVAGNNYHRYDHKLFPHSQGMGDNGRHGDINTVIKWTLEDIERQPKKNIIMNEETFKRKMRAAIWKAFMQFEKDIESEDAEAELKERFDKYVKSEKLDKKAKRSILCRLGFHEYYGKPISGKGYITDGQCVRPGCFNFK